MLTATQPSDSGFPVRQASATGKDPCQLVPHPDQTQSCALQGIGALHQHGEMRMV